MLITQAFSFPSGRKKHCLLALQGRSQSPMLVFATYYWAPVEAQMVKNPPAMPKTWARSLVERIGWRRGWQPTPFPGGCSHRELACQCRRHKRHRFNPCDLLRVRKIPWRMAWQPTPGFLPGEPHGQRSLVAYGP